ncbi:TPA: hypothetical protein ACOSAX_004673 [Salmonella enterica]
MPTIKKLADARDVILHELILHELIGHLSCAVVTVKSSSHTPRWRYRHYPVPYRCAPA